MIRVFCLLATEDRIWNMRRALRSLENSHSGLVEGSCWSVWDVTTHPEKLPAMMEDAATCDFGIVYFHGGAQSMQDFHLLWGQLAGHMPVYFESSIADEIAEFLTTSGLTPVAVMLTSAVTMALCGILMKKLKWKWLNDYALPIALVAGMAAAIPLTAWLG